mgnify:FL=1
MESTKTDDYLSGISKCRIQKATHYNNKTESAKVMKQNWVEIIYLASIFEEETY